MADYQLRRVQGGMPPTDWKPMSSIGPGVAEIRIHARLEHRVVYLAKFAEAVYVLHAFGKRSQGTRRADLAIARSRLAEVHELRRNRKER